jgi:ubiquinone/menaquinone biosynthesis C-methylase UbiE
MMEERKKTEIDHYDKKAEEWLGSSQKENSGDFEGFDPFLLSSYKFLQEYLKDKCKGKKILDYGCGNGVHSFWLGDCGAEVTGIDLSEKSLEVARKKAGREKAGDKVKFLVMDCEKLDFPDDSFDIIFDGGTFSSLDINKAYPELARVLKPSGFLIGIETFGHNPVTNLKRKINEVFGKRTGWAASHIFKTDNFKDAKKYFGQAEINFFHLTSWAVFPFLKNNFSKKALKVFEKIDTVLLKAKRLKKYSFKVVFILSKPKK